jgi:hypothetical protein
LGLGELVVLAAAILLQALIGIGLIMTIAKELQVVFGLIILNLIIF